MINRIKYKNMKVKSIEELRYYIIDMITSAEDTSLISKTYEAVSGNIVTERVKVNNSSDDFVYVYES